MAIVTMQEIMTSALRFADMERSTFISPQELLAYLNFAVNQYWNKVNNTMQDYNIKEDVFQLIGGQTDYPAPADFLYVRGVDVSIAVVEPTSDQFWEPLMPYEFKERGNYSYPFVTSYYGVYAMRYRIFQGDPTTFIRFLPQPIAGLFIRLSYIPFAPQFTSPYDTMNGYNGFETYIAALMALRMLGREESDTSEIKDIIAEWNKTIATNAQDRNRDIGQKVTRIRNRSWWGGGFPGW